MTRFFLPLITLAWIGGLLLPSPTYSAPLAIGSLGIAIFVGYFGHQLEARTWDHTISACRVYIRMDVLPIPFAPPDSERTLSY